MKSTTEWLDAAKLRLDLPSDYALAKAFGVSRQAISLWRSGRQPLPDEMCLRVAEVVDADPFEVIASVRIERTNESEKRAVWMRALEKFSRGFRTLALRANAHGVRFSGV